MTKSVAKKIPEFIIHKIILQSYYLSPHPTAKIIKDYAHYYLWSQFPCKCEENEIKEFKKRYDDGEDIEDELLYINIYTWDNAMEVERLDCCNRDPSPKSADELEWYNECVKNKKY